MTPEEISSLYKQGQGEIVGFEVEAVSLNRLAETLAAFANAGGGNVLLGVDPQGGIVRGIKNADAAIEKALTAGLRCEPPLVLPRPESAMLEGKSVLLIQVSPGLPHAYGLHGKYLARVGKKNTALGPRQLRQLLRERGEANFEALPAPGATLDDFDDVLVQKYAAAFLGVPPLNKKDAILDLLYRRNCILRDGSA